MGHPVDPDKLFEVLGNKLRPIVRNNPGMRFGKLFPGSLEDNFNITFCHRLSDLPMNDIPTVTIKDTTQIIERSLDIQI